MPGGNPDRLLTSGGGRGWRLKLIGELAECRRRVERTFDAATRQQGRTQDEKDGLCAHDAPEAKAVMLSEGSATITQRWIGTSTRSSTGAGAWAGDSGGRLKGWPGWIGWGD